MITRRVFFSFVYSDSWRANQVRKSQEFSDSKVFFDAAEFEKVKRQSDAAIRNWIDDQMSGASVTVVLIGQQTYASKWVDYELRNTIQSGMGLLGVRIHKCKDENKLTSPSGPIPIAMQGAGHVYDWVFDDGRSNIQYWIDDAAKAAGR